MIGFFGSGLDTRIHTYGAEHEVSDKPGSEWMGMGEERDRRDGRHNLSMNTAMRCDESRVWGNYDRGMVLSFQSATYGLFARGR